MNKKEIYISIGLIYLMFISIHIKKNYLTNKPEIGLDTNISDSVEIPIIPDSLDFETNIIEKERYYPQSDSLKKGYLGKRKPDPEGWTEKYGKYLKELKNLI